MDALAAMLDDVLADQRRQRAETEARSAEIAKLLARSRGW
jgi:hypothetical protein